MTQSETQGCLEWLSSIVVSILVAFGVQGTPEEVSSVIMGEFATMFEDAISHALQFQEAVGEKVVSGHFSLLVAHPGAPFDPHWMEVDQTNLGIPPSEAVRRSKVICTTQLGLEMETRTAKARGERQERNIKLFLKSKVVSVEGVADAVESDDS